MLSPKHSSRQPRATIREARALTIRSVAQLLEKSSRAPLAKLRARAKITCRLQQVETAYSSVNPVV